MIKKRSSAVKVLSESRPAEYRTACSGRAFSLVELLVVITIVGILVAMMIPALAKSRDTARELRCMANMRQVFTMAATFRTDIGYLLPNSWFARYPNGFNSFDYPVNGGLNAPADRGNVNSFAFLLIARGYAPDTTAPFSATYEAKDAASRNSVFYCPNMFTRFRSNYFDTRSWVTANQVSDPIERRSACYFADNYYDTSNLLRRTIMNGYRINELAGGSGYYYIYSGLTNRGFYRRKHWKTQSEDRVGFLFENNMWTTGGVWQYVDSITTQNYSYGNYGPPVRHNSYQSTNLIFADGHGVKFATPAFTNLAAISDTSYPVSMVFE